MGTSNGEVGNSVLQVKAGANAIEVYTNPKYYKKSRNQTLFYGAVFSLGLFYISKGDYNWFFLIFVSSPFLLSVLMAIGYERQAKRKLWLTIAIKEKAFILKAGRKYAFSAVDCFFISQLQSADHQGTSYQLNILFKNKKELMLFTDDSRSNIEQAAEMLSQKTKIRLLQKVVDA